MITTSTGHNQRIFSRKAHCQNIFNQRINFGSLRLTANGRPDFGKLGNGKSLPAQTIIVSICDNFTPAVLIWIEPLPIIASMIDFFTSKNAAQSRRSGDSFDNSALFHCLFNLRKKFLLVNDSPTRNPCVIIPVHIRTSQNDRHSKSGRK